MTEGADDQDDDFAGKFLIGLLVVFGVFVLVILSDGLGDTNMMRAEVREKLKDPDSAKWGATVLIRGFEERIPDKYGYATYACLEVNAKNGFGGYTGTKVWLIERSKSRPNSYRASQTSYSATSTCALLEG